MHSSRFSATGTSHYAFIRILSSRHFSSCIHLDSQLLAPLTMHSLGFSAPGTSHSSLIRILNFWHFSLCIHRDSQRPTLFIMHSSGLSATATSRNAHHAASLGSRKSSLHQNSKLAHLVVVKRYPHSGRLHLSEINHRGSLLTRWRADLPVTPRGARE